MKGKSSESGIVSPPFPTLSRVKLKLLATVVFLTLAVFASPLWAADCVTPPPNMTAWYPGDGNANDIQGSNHGTLQNGATFAPGMVTQAFSLDGVDDSVQAPQSPSLTSSFTIDAWIKPDSLTGINPVVFERGDSTSSRIGLQVTSAGGLCGYFDSLICNISAPAGTITPGTFTHVALVLDDAADQLRLYVNGALVATATDNRSPNNLGPLTIGDSPTSNIAGEFFDGLIDEVEVFNRALSEAEIQSIISAGSAGKCKNEPPENSVPNPQTANEDTPLVFSTANGNAISVSDPDAGSAEIQTTLSVDSGALTLGGTAGLTFSQGDGTSDETMTFTGSQSDINAVLNGLTYAPAQDFNGSDTLTITTNDKGNTGAGGAQEDTDAVQITVNPVNDSPVAANDGIFKVRQGKTLRVNAPGLLANDTDSDAQTLKVADGNTSDTDLAGEVDPVSGPSKGTLTLREDGSFVYKPKARGLVTFTYRASDGTANSNVATVTIKVRPR